MIGIGAGDPDQLTLQAVKALNRVDVFFLLDKGAEKSDLIRLRHDILAEHVAEGREYRLVEARDPDRDRTAGGRLLPGRRRLAQPARGHLRADDR